MNKNVVVFIKLKFDYLFKTTILKYLITINKSFKLIIKSDILSHRIVYSKTHID